MKGHLNADAGWCCLQYVSTYKHVPNGSLLNILSDDLLSTGFAPIKYKLIYMLVQGNVGKKSLSYKN